MNQSRVCAFYCTAYIHRARCGGRYLELLLEAKSQLNESPLGSQELLIKNLHAIASSTQLLAEQRTGSPKGAIWSEIADKLDQEGLDILFLLLPGKDQKSYSMSNGMYAVIIGVNLWNISGLVRKGSDRGAAELTAARTSCFLGGNRLVIGTVDHHNVQLDLRRSAWLRQG